MTNRSDKQKRKKRRVNARMLKRLAIVVFCVFGVYIAVVVALANYQIKDTDTYKKSALTRQDYSSQTLYYRRGDILDRKGSFLATSKKIYNLVLEPKNIIESKKFKADDEHTYQDITIDAIDKYFDINKSELEDVLNENPNSFYYVAKTKLTYEDVCDYLDYAKSDEGKYLRGINLEENYEREYPNGSAGCHLIGYTSAGNVGNWGMEQQYNDTLNGTDGRRYRYMDESGAIVTEMKNATDGNTIVSTIDLNIQNIVDKQVKKFMSSVGAKNVSVLVMDPNNAEILAMSNSKSYDLNDPYNEEYLQMISSDAEIAVASSEAKLQALNEIWRNRAISDTYEPGSTFKPFTMCAALEEGKTYDGEEYYCGGKLHVGDWDIKCHNADGTITIKQAIAKSCNVTMMQINEKLGAETFTKYQSIFGFGQYTGVDLPGEASASSLIYNAENIGPTDLAINSFGQGFNCTMIQLATGFCSLINGGDYYQPHVVKEIRNSEGGTVETIDKKLMKKTVSKSTSKLIRSYLKEVVDSGTGTGCQIPGYEIGGKTGTAEKLPRNNGKYLLSFISFAPYANPEVMVYVTIDEIALSPQDQTSYAVHLARNILSDLLPYMGIEQVKVKDEDEQKVVNVNENGTAVSDTGDKASDYLLNTDDISDTTDNAVSENADPNQATTEANQAQVTEAQVTEAVATEAIQ
ncbi:MAG: penicillin-binding protein 2 [Lachnospiraceae bacterium]|nr:penicillin-binding protein 2 [Lachnospiraceae bacterium]